MKFRKRPVVVEAYKTDEIIDIHTPEGTMRADKGDWIITGVQGEKYPCKPGPFKETYDLVEDKSMLTNHEEPGITYNLCGDIVGYKVSDEYAVFLSKDEVEKAVKDYVDIKMKRITAENWYKERRASIGNPYFEENWIYPDEELPDNEVFDYVLAVIKELQTGHEYPMVVMYDYVNQDWWEESIGNFKDSDVQYEVVKWRPIPEY